MKNILFLILINTHIIFAQGLNDLSFGTNNTFDIISWNIEWFPKNNLTSIYVETILSNLEADIYALQEIDDTTLLKQLVSNIPGYECYFGDDYFGGLAFVYNSNVIQVNSMYEIFSSQQYWNAFPRSPLVIDLNFNGDNYIIMNNHFKCCGDGLLDISTNNDEENRRLQAVSLLKEYIENNLSNKKVIVLGDLNDDLIDQNINNIFLQLIDDSANYLFTDMQIAQGSSSGWSYPNWPSHLDHILITDELFEEFQQYNSEVTVIKVDDYMNNWNEYDNNISDHRPIGLKLDAINTALINEEIKPQDEVLNIVDVLGRKSNNNSNGIIFYIFRNGMVKKVFPNTEYK